MSPVYAADSGPKTKTRTQVPALSVVPDGGPALAALTGGPAAAPTQLPVTAIVHHPLNPAGRSEVDEELAAAIRADGAIHEPLVVRPVEDGAYELLSGHRRLAAAQHLGMLLVPVVVKNLDDAKAATLLLSAKLNRRDLTLVEEAVMVQGILDLPGAGTQHDLATTLGRSDTWVSRRAKVARAGDDVLTALAAAPVPATFEDVEAIAEFEDHPEEHAKVVAAFGTDDFDQVARTARWQIRRREGEARLTEYLEAHDAQLVIADPHSYSRPDEVQGLTIADGGQYIDFDRLVADPAEVLAGYGGMTPETTGFALVRRGANASGVALYRPRTPKEQAEYDALTAENAARDAEFQRQQAQRDAQVAQNAERAKVLERFVETTADGRRAHLLKTIAAKRLDRTQVDAIVAFAAAAVTSAWDVCLGGDYVASDELGPWLGLDLEAIAITAEAEGADPDDAEIVAYEASLAKASAPQKLLAALAYPVEPISAWRWSKATNEDMSPARAWYVMLEALGYTVSTEEREALAGLLPGVAA